MSSTIALQKKYLYFYLISRFLHPSLPSTISFIPCLSLLNPNTYLVCLPFFRESVIYTFFVNTVHVNKIKVKVLKALQVSG